MKRIHIIGGKNHGKTTLVAELVRELSARGYRVGTIKHTHHQHELDTPGKDSHRHREAGAAVVGILTRSLSAVFWQANSLEFATSDDRYEAFAHIFADCQLTIVEGDTQTAAVKIEVWCQSLGSEPLARSDTSIQAVVTHDEIQNLATPIWPRADIAAVVDKVLAIVKIE